MRKPPIKLAVHGHSGRYFYVGEVIRVNSGPIKHVVRETGDDYIIVQRARRYHRLRAWLRRLP